MKAHKCPIVILILNTEGVAKVQAAFDLEVKARSLRLVRIPKWTVSCISVER